MIKFAQQVCAISQLGLHRVPKTDWYCNRRVRRFEPKRTEKVIVGTLCLTVS